VQQLGRAAVPERDAGDDDDVVAGAREAARARDTRGVLDHLGDVVHVLERHRMHAPHQREAARGGELRREAEDRRGGALARRAQRREARGRERHRLPGTVRRKPAGGGWPCGRDVSSSRQAV
jgi:hypothetical protein